MNPKELGDFYRNILLDEVVPFWFPRAVDATNGGLYHCFDRDGTLVDSDKSVWAQGRMAWMLLTCYNFIEKRPEWLSAAESALNFLKEHCVDEDGRMFFQVAADGTPIRKRRYAYSECFAAIGWAAHFGATRAPESAKLARNFFDIYADINFTPGKMAPKSTGKRPSMGLGPHMIMLVTAQEMRRYFPEDAAYYTEWIDRSIHDLRTYFIKPDIKAVMECVAPDGSIIDHFDERTLNPGHAIEGGWFILEEARYRNNDESLIKIGCDMIDWSLERGWDQQYGGLLYFTDVYGKPCQEYWHNMKFWWPHDEALIGTALAYRMTGDDKYLSWHNRIREWSFTHLQDKEHGEWYGYCLRDGSPSSTLKGSMWKSFFHHPRALFCCAQHFGSVSNTPI